MTLLRLTPWLAARGCGGGAVAVGGDQVRDVALGGFRVWWRRWHGDSDEDLDNTHLMRMAGRFARRVRAWASAHQVPVIDCKRGERKHQLAEDYLAEHTVGPGVFLILVARASAPVWEVTRSSSGVLVNLAKKMAFVNHYSFTCLLVTG